MVVQNILSYGRAFSRLYILDNSPGGSDFGPVLSRLQGIEAVLISFPSNPGIAKALKVACDAARKDGFKFLLTMDQDSSFPKDTDFEAIKDCILNRPDVSNYGQYALPYWPATKTSEETWYWACSSGTFINLEAYGLIRGFDEGLVVDLADFDLGFQFFEIGKPTLVLNRFRFNHQVGYGSRKKSLFGKTFTCRVYSPFRYYYILRNDLILRKRYPRLFKPLSGKDEVIGALLCLKPRLQYFKAIVCALFDGKRGKLGKYKPHARYDRKLAKKNEGL